MLRGDVANSAETEGLREPKGNRRRPIHSATQEGESEVNAGEQDLSNLADGEQGASSSARPTGVMSDELGVAQRRARYPQNNTLRTIALSSEASEPAQLDSVQAPVGGGLGDGVTGAAAAGLNADKGSVGGIGGAISLSNGGAEDSAAAVEADAVNKADVKAAEDASKGTSKAVAEKTTAASDARAAADELEAIRQRARRVHTEFRSIHGGPLMEGELTASTSATMPASTAHGGDANAATTDAANPATLSSVQESADGIGAELRRCPVRMPHYRIAMLIPWVGMLPKWSSYFFSSAATAAPLVDFLIFHEGQKHLLPVDTPPNVIFTDLGPGGLAQIMGMGLGEALELPIRNATVVIKAMRLMFEKWPRLVAEYKPAFGSVFASYLKEYTHWGYCDLDMVIGNLPLFVEQAELDAYDIVSYSFGDMEAMYLRGQWTTHRNNHYVNTIWKGCPHLGVGLQKELLLKVAWQRRMEARGIQNYPKRFQSAEGCYSQRAVGRRGIRIRIAHKQLVGLTVPADQVIYSVSSSVWQCPENVKVDVNELALHAAAGRCQVALPGLPVQRNAVQELWGSPEPISLTTEGCGQWMPPEYRMCARELLDGGSYDTPSTDLIYVNGTLMVQRFRSSSSFVLPNGCRQGAFFHFQEWKKAWAGPGTGYGTLVDIEMLGDSPRFSARPRNFTATPDGISLLHSPGASTVT